jgi:hypothetical protein
MKHKIEIAPLADYYIIAVKDKETDKLVDTFTLNESATDILKLFCQGKDTAAVTQVIAEMYDAPHEKVLKDVASIAKRLNSKGVL